jgi:hypothetical protein
MPRRTRKTRRAKKKPFKANQGTIWFLAILVVSAFAAVYPIDPTVIMLLLGIFGAIVALLNITAKEELNYLVGVTALVVLILAWRASILLPSMLDSFLHYLTVGFGVAGFVLALALLAKLGLDK